MHRSIEAVISRRRFATGAIAAPIAASAAPAVSSGVDPMPAMVAEWLVAHDHLNATAAAMPDLDYETAFEAEREMSERIATTTPETLEGATAFLGWIIKEQGEEFRSGLSEPWASALEALHGGLKRIEATQA